MLSGQVPENGPAERPTFPLIELHCHLEGAITASDVLNAKRALGLVDADFGQPDDLDLAITLPPGTWPLATWRPIFDRRRRCFESLDMVEELTRQVVLRYHRNGARHLELRFNPVYMGSLNALDPVAVVRRVVAGAVPPNRRMSTAVIVLATRDRGADEAAETARVAVHFAGDGVAGFDLAGPERGHPAGAFAEAFNIARSGGLRLTAHAGEEVGPESIHAALDVLRVERIGHGLTVTAAPQLVSSIIGEGVALEMCPLSNIRTGCTGSITEHPAAELLREGVRVTINADDPGLFGSALTDDFRAITKAAQLTNEEVRRLVSNAAEAAFLPFAEVERLLADVRADFDHAEKNGLTPVGLLEQPSSN